jgi:PAS domain S-box-containing protein
MTQYIDQLNNPSQALDCFVGNGEMAALMRAMDWSKTAVGPVELWPQSLKIVVRIMLTSRYAMWMQWGEEGTFFYNDAYRPTLGVKHPWALGAPAQQVWAEIWTEIGPRIETVLQTGQATWDEGLQLFLERSGYAEETYHTFSYSPLADERGAIRGMLCVVTEVTDRVIGERRLALLREVATALAATQTQEAVCAAIRNCLEADQCDLPFTLTYLFAPDGGSADLLCRTGIPAGHALDVPRMDVSKDAASPWPAQQLLDGTTSLLLDDLTARFLDLPTGAWDRPARQALVVPLARQGQERPAGFLVAALNPYRRLDAEYRGFVDLLAGQIAAGIANAFAYENERQRAEALAELDCAKTAFFSNVSHEFRTPLTLMLGPLEDALTAPERALEGENLEVVHRNGMRLLKLVNTLLDFSRIEAGRVQAIYEPTDLSRYTAELASVFRSAIERAGMRLLVDCPPLSQPVFVDREMWEKIVLNLLSNAFKFTEAGEIEVRLYEAADSVRLSVRDTGVGIAAEQLPHIFERFHRVEGARARTHEGTGIGLALVQELARLHGGEVTVNSVYGDGSTFAVTIPLGEAHLPADRIRGERTLASTTFGANPYVEEALRWSSHRENRAGESDPLFDAPLLSAAPNFRITRTGDDEAGGGRRHCILVADDNADMREYVARLLSHRYEVVAVPDGRAALEAVKEGRPDLVLCDVMMPRLNGFELLQQLRADPRTAAIPVILLSARAGEEAHEEGLSVGADDYLIKPFSARELLARVGAHLEMARVRAEAARSIKESEERLRAALDASETGVFRWDIRTGALDWDDNLHRLFGRAPGDKVKTLEAFLAIVHPDERDEVIERCRLCAQEGADFEMEFRVIWPDGTLRWLYDRGKTVPDAAGIPLYMTGACVDITERKRREAQIEALNVRLRRAMTETHHRVKNNLQLMSALIDMQRQEKRETAPVSELERLSQNIQALGVIHEILTEEAKADGDAALISSAAVLERLLPMLQRTLAGRRLEFAVDDVKLPGRKATSLALITNELISNAVKHGKGAIDVKFRVVDRTATLTVCDDGAGFPANFDARLAANTGLELIENIARWDLGGAPAYTNRPQGGACVIIAFPVSYSGV